MQIKLNIKAIHILVDNKMNKEILFLDNTLVRFLAGKQNRIQNIVKTDLNCLAFQLHICSKCIHVKCYI